jgi:ATP-dependent helicase/nuclease subunit A
VGSITAKQFEARWKQDGEINTTALLHARSYADWLGMWFAKNCAATAGEDNCGETNDCRWFLHDDASLIESVVELEAAKTRAVVHLSGVEIERLRKKLETKYPFAAATKRPAKTSVSALRRRAMEILEQEESVEFFGPRIRTRKTETDSVVVNSTVKKSAADVGTVHHRFLERVAFDRMDGVEELKAEAERMVSEGVLVNEEVQWLNFDSLLKFWRSDFGRKILANAKHVKRELAFTVRFSPAELPREAGTKGTEELENEFVVVQGVADVAVILPKEIWLLDFKTDRVAANQSGEKAEIYRPQLDLYARALERIHDRPVTERRLHFLSCGITVPLGNVSKA